VGIKPIKLQGSWDEGFALDIHTFSSTLIGEDEYGHKRFDTVRSEMGELIYQFKNKNRYEKLSEIIALARPFVESWEALETVVTVLPAPSTKTRSYQPAQEIAKRIAEIIGAYYVDNVLNKQGSVQSKDLSAAEKSQLKGTIQKKKSATREHSVLIIDDLYESGGTLNDCVRVLRTDKNIKYIYVLAMTKTRTSR